MSATPKETIRQKDPARAAQEVRRIWAWQNSLVGAINAAIIHIRNTIFNPNTRDPNLIRKGKEAREKLGIDNTL